MEGEKNQGTFILQTFLKLFMSIDIILFFSKLLKRTPISFEQVELFICTPCAQLT